jgi:hypothetical protein
MTPFLRKLSWWVRRKRKEAELEDELQFHLDEDTGERTAEGLSIDEARRAARRDLGSLSIVREDTRAAWTWALLEQLAQDLRYGVRMLAANKTFSAMAILSLALGIGANTAIFSFMDAMLMRSLPVSDPESLVTLTWDTKREEMHGSNRHNDSYTDPSGGFVGGVFAYQAFELFQRDTSVFTTVFGYQGAGNLHVEISGQAQIANVEYVSGQYFSGLGVSAASGRLIGPGDDRVGAPAVAVISHELAVARFGHPATASGQSILLDHIPFTVVGVTSQRNKYARAAERYTDPNYDWVVPMARCAQGGEQAHTALS